ncbi:MAG: M56 family metallopeptidase [Prolixibacteraceae bacterium]|nr:M56 family metallopeptidase [Prolixibacteraceae bacterium]
MNYFVNYIIEAGLSLGIFTFVYWFMLRRETRYTATRFYLLFALLFSTLLPFITIRLKIFASTAGELPGIDTTQVNLLETVTVYASGVPQRIGNLFLSFDYAMLIYILGAFAALFVISAGVFQLLRKVSVNRIFRLRKVRLVVSDKEFSPYSFFNFIFISNTLTKQENWKSMVQHELEHVRQGHSFDVLFVDVMMVFQWFNPFYWMIRRMVRENHEFLADKGVLKLGSISAAHYKKLLLSQAIGGSPVMTSNFFSIKTIKKRFKMITNNKNKKFTALRYSIGVVVALALTVMFACEKYEAENEMLSENIIFKGGLISQEEFEQMEIYYMQFNDIDRLDALYLYPELKEHLTADTYSVVFEEGDPSASEIMNKLGSLKNFSVSINSSSKPIDILEDDRQKSNVSSNGEEVFAIVEEMPQFPGGDMALLNYIKDNVDYPSIAIDNGIEGKVYVYFVIGSDGVVSDVKIARGVDPSLDAEALRVVSSLPNWVPGKQRGENVAVSYNIPINFSLQEQ